MSLYLIIWSSGHFVIDGVIGGDDGTADVTDRRSGCNPSINGWMTR